MLYIVATPIGNLSDITFRAIEVLKSVDLILCEDTRQTKILLDRYCIVKQLVSYHQHSKIEKVDFIIRELEETDLATGSGFVETMANMRDISDLDLSQLKSIYQKAKNKTGKKE